MIKEGDKLKITGFDCGYKAIIKFKSLGITNDKIITIKTIQPIHGPYTIIVDKSEYSIGRGMFEKLKYVILDDKIG